MSWVRFAQRSLSFMRSLRRRATPGPDSETLPSQPKTPSGTLLLGSDDIDSRRAQLLAAILTEATQTRSRWSQAMTLFVTDAMIQPSEPDSDLGVYRVETDDERD